MQLQWDKTPLLNVSILFWRIGCVFNIDENNEKENDDDNDDDDDDDDRTDKERESKTGVQFTQQIS